jgi:cinnamoyl-CoA reductase
MMAEKTATEEAAKRGLELAVVLPSMTTGPGLQQAMSISNYHIARYMMGAKKVSPNAVAAYTDVRDVARAHVLVYESRSIAPGGRYLCIGAVLHRTHLVQLLRDLFPHYHVTARYMMFSA